jgi:hypothetical protein
MEESKWKKALNRCGMMATLPLERTVVSKPHSRAAVIATLVISAFKRQSNQLLTPRRLRVLRMAGALLSWEWCPQLS